MQTVTGKVVDSVTKKPLSGVKVYKQGNKDVFSVTNQRGEFEVRSISGGLFRCPPMKIKLEKEGYESRQQKGGATIELKKR